MTVTTLTEMLVRDEGEVLHLYYLDGIPHIGVGCNLMAAVVQPEIAKQVTITPSASRALLDRRTRDVLLDLATLPWIANLSERRRAVLVNVCYNVGFHGLIEFHDMLSAMKAGDWNAAAAELLDSKAAVRNPDRYKRLAKQLLTDAWV